MTLPRAALVVASCFLAVLPGTALAQTHGTSPYRLVDDWAQLPDGREIGAVGKVTMDPDGEHLWAVIRCDAGFDMFGYECLNSDLDPVVKFDMDGNVVTSFGGGLFIWPHGIDVDSEGNVWVTDSATSGRIPEGDSRGHRVIKFSPRGEVLMILGTGGEEGSGPHHFTSPSDVAVAEDGSVFVADGHNNDGNNRVVKYGPDGTFLQAWGRTGWAPGEFRALHAIDIGPDGRVFVGDRSNNRVQIFDQEGNVLAVWTQFGRPSGIAFDDEGHIYVADSESDNVQNPGWEMGIRIGDAETGWVHEFIPYMWGDPHEILGNGAEFVAVDPDGNIYGGEPIPRKLQKYVRVRP